MITLKAYQKRVSNLILNFHFFNSAEIILQLITNGQRMRKERKDGKGTRTNVHTSVLSENENTGGGDRQRRFYTFFIYAPSCVRACVRARIYVCVCVCMPVWLCVFLRLRVNEILRDHLAKNTKRGGRGMCLCVYVCLHAYVVVSVFFAVLRSPTESKGGGAETRGGKEWGVCLCASLHACVALCVFLRSRSPTGLPCEKHHGEEEVCVCFIFFVVSHSPAGLLVCVSFFVFQQEKKKYFEKYQWEGCVYE